MKHIALNCRDLIELEGFQGTRTYGVQGIHYGALHQEDVIELLSLDLSDPDAHGKKQMMFVPLVMLCAGISAGIFKHTPSTQLDT